MLHGLGVASDGNPPVVRRKWLIAVFVALLAGVSWRLAAEVSIPNIASLTSSPRVGAAAAESGPAPALSSSAAAMAAPPLAAALAPAAGIAPVAAAVGEPAASAGSVAEPAAVPAARSDLQASAAPVDLPAAPSAPPATAPATTARSSAVRPTDRSVGVRSARVLRTPKTEPDPDVALVAALIAHAAPPAAARRSKGGPGALTSAIATSKRPARLEHAPAPAQSGAPRLSVEHQVRRCQRLATPGDALGCVRRSCARHWGRHAACPQKLQPRAQRYAVAGSLS
jgi:hypothetical protein